MRLDKFISSQLYVSRTDAKKMLRQKRITVNGVLQMRPETDIDPEKNEIRLDGGRIVYKKYLYIMMNKPAGVVSASAGEREKNVIDLLPTRFKRPGLFPAGRLDKDSTGMLLITDDGNFSHYILSPAHHVEKTYFITLNKPITKEQSSLIENGLDIGNEKFKPASVTYIGMHDDAFGYQIVLTEGKYHEIRRIFAFFDNPVISLQRTAIGGLSLDKALIPGQCRELNEDELHMIDASYFNGSST